ncbi:DNA cytosine methyltransferase [Pseudarthrobacter sp. HLT3-5]|nr:DNA cytosine methyltransferase [Pseudarthrobacter sp. HLT3-5]
MHAAYPAAECVGYSEIDKYAISVYERKFPETHNYGDITKINAAELPDFDLLVGGFPCQAFSIAGNRRGFEDTRGTLFFDLARILWAKSPRLFVFENVKGLLSHDDGATFKTIIAAIDELGYDCQWQVLNSKNHGVPQTRDRIVIVGHLRGTPRPQVFPFGESGGRHPQAQGGTQGQGQRIRSDDLSGWCEAETPLIAKTLAVRDYKGGNNLLQYDDGSIRRLTPKESERLQGFPDDWTKYGKDDELISDTQRYKMCGNAVTTNVFHDVFAKIFEVAA